LLISAKSSCSEVLDLIKNPPAPSEAAALMVSSLLTLVSMMTSMFLVSGSAFRALRTSNPLILGMRISKRIRRGLFSLALARPVGPSSAISM